MSDRPSTPAAGGGSRPPGVSVIAWTVLATGAINLLAIPLEVGWISIPGTVREGQPFDLRIVLNNTKQPTSDAAGEVRGRLVIKRRGQGRSTTVSEQTVTLPSGEPTPYKVRQELPEAGFYEYEAVFYPEREEDDTMPQNNRATAFAQIRGKGKVLLIVNEEVDSPASSSAWCERSGGRSFRERMERAGRST